MLGLEESRAGPASISDADTSQHLEKRLRYISGTLVTIRDSVGRLVPGHGFDNCLLQVSEERVDNLKSELSDVTRDILCTKDTGKLSPGSSESFQKV